MKLEKYRKSLFIHGIQSRGERIQPWDDVTLAYLYEIPFDKIYDKGDCHWDAYPKQLVASTCMKILQGQYGRFVTITIGIEYQRIKNKSVLLLNTS